MQEKQRLDDQFVSALKLHRNGMYRVAYTMLRSHSDAEDAVSQATLNAYRSIHKIRSWDTIKAYLMRITVNACHDIIRKRQREVVADTSTLLDTQPIKEDSPIWMYTQQLSIKLRTVLHLRYAENMPLEEIARVLRVPKGTVSSRLNRAQLALRKSFEKEEM